MLIHPNLKAFSLLWDELSLLKTLDLDQNSETKCSFLLSIPLKTIYLCNFWCFCDNTLFPLFPHGSLFFDLLIWKQALQPCFVALFFLWFREVARMCGTITEVNVSSYKQMERATHQSFSLTSATFSLKRMRRKCRKSLIVWYPQRPWH